MLSKEEFALLQQKLVQITEERDGYAKKVEELTEQNEKIPELQQKMEELEKQNEKDELSQMSELKDATVELNTVRSEMNSISDPQDNRKIKKLEAQLEALKEKTKKLDDQLIELDENDKKNSEMEIPLDEQISIFQKHVEKLKKYQEKMPQASKLSMQVNDLESKRDQLQNMITSLEKKIPELDENEASAENDKLMKMAELRRVQAEIDSVNESIKTSDNQHIECYKMLNKVSIKLQEVNDASRIEKAKMDDLVVKYADKKKEAINEGKAIEAQIKELEEQLESFPARKQQEISDIETKVAKSKQMAEQLEKKRDELRAEIQKKMSESNIVGELTAVMEQEWVEHQKLLDQKEKMQASVNRATEDLRRKILASEEIEKRWPKSSKPFKAPGMAELEYLYEQALQQNRKLGETLASLKDDLEIIRNDNILLKSFATKK